jgi:hypothetical protein
MLVQVLNKYYEAAHWMAIPWPVTKVKAMNIHSIQPFNDDAQRTNIHHTFFYIQKCNFRCPET